MQYIPLACSCMSNGILHSGQVCVKASKAASSHSYGSQCDAAVVLLVYRLWTQG